MTYDSIEQIFQRLEEILRNEKQEPLSQLGSYIVGCTIVQDGIEEYYEEYPELAIIADLGSDLEYQGEEYEQEYMDSIRVNMDKLRTRMAA